MYMIVIAIITLTLTMCQAKIHTYTHTFYLSLQKHHEKGTFSQMMKLRVTAAGFQIRFV